MSTKVKFTDSVTTKESPPQHFEKDQVVDFLALYRDDPDMKALHGDKLEAAAHARAQASARHWMNRGKAVDADKDRELREGKPRARAEESKPEHKTPTK